jgi:glycine reductase complex component B subunit gamma
MIRVVHYVNQFFGQIGGEEKAKVGPSLMEGAVGPGTLINSLLIGKGKVVATVICGDNYFAQNPEAAAREILDLLSGWKADVFIAGPAFDAGRYGLACGEMCKAVSETLAIPAVTGMFIENPGVGLYRRHVFIVETANGAAGMTEAMGGMIGLAGKLLSDERLGAPGAEGYIPRGYKENILTDTLASERAINLLLKKLKGEMVASEITFPELDLVPPARPIRDLREATIALVTEGGLVPRENPDAIPDSRAARFGKYRVDELLELGCEKFASIHRGFDRTFVNEDCNRLLPADVLAEMEKEGIIKQVHPFFYSTTGAATTVENSHRMGRGIASELVAARVTGALIVAT